MSPLEPSNPTTVGTEKSNIDEAQAKDIKTAFMNMIEILNVEMNKFLQEIYENTNTGRKRMKQFRS